MHTKLVGFAGSGRIEDSVLGAGADLLGVDLKIK
jgi:hypothetical protein